MVRQHDGRAAPLPGDAGEELMTDLPRRHFNGEFLTFREGSNRPPANRARHLELSAVRSDEPFIGVTAASPELMVEMGDNNRPGT
jgi:hypothetical protein